MQYAFVLGRVYTLSLAELFNVLARMNVPIKVLDISPEVLIIETEVALDAEKLQRSLGGVIKILKIVDTIAKKDTDSINFVLQNYFSPSKLKTDFLKDYKGKIQFGISVYLLNMDIKAFGEPKRLGMFIKRGLQDLGASIRLVIPEFNSLALASVVVTKNLLLTKGAEIVVIAGVTRLYTAKTLAVQDFEDYGRRDYQRPTRDEKQGMIPPKVAQVMLNMANVQANEVLLDPFAGIGTIVQEGVLLGYRMLGSDINPIAITGSEKNLEWFRNRYKVSPGKFHVEVADAKEVSTLVAKLAEIGAYKTVSGIVTEGYLGPMYGKFPRPHEIEANFKELSELYTGAFQDWLKFLSKGARIVLCLPAYKKNVTEYEMFPNLDFLTSLGYNFIDLIPSTLTSSIPFLRLTERGSVIYDRKDQVVAREIVIFEKI